MATCNACGKDGQEYNHCGACICSDCLPAVERDWHERGIHSDEHCTTYQNLKDEGKL